MNQAAKFKKAKIEKLFENVKKFKFKEIKEKFIGPEYGYETPLQKIYILKKLYSIVYCLKENKILREKISDDLFKLLKKSSKVYFYFILEILTDFHKINRNELLIVLGKHLVNLIPNRLLDR